LKKGTIYHDAEGGLHFITPGMADWVGTHDKALEGVTPDGRHQEGTYQQAEQLELGQRPPYDERA